MSHVDEEILSHCDDTWRKVAMIVAKVRDEIEGRGVQITAEEIGLRIENLIQAKKLEVLGDIRDWRHSEVRRISGLGL